MSPSFTSAFIQLPVDCRPRQKGEAGVFCDWPAGSIVAQTAMIFDHD